jgi:lipopolysaccharide biosynthesis protein
MNEATCYFSSYFNGNTIPYYVVFYIEELSRHFSRIVFITNKKQLGKSSQEVLEKNGITLYCVENEGYDFGMWYKALKAFPPAPDTDIALVNDSCILFTSLDSCIHRIREEKADYSGLVISDRYERHIQSYFLMIGANAVPDVLNYFAQHGIVHDYRTVIQTYEIGLTQEMLRKGFRVMGLFNNDMPAFPKNPSFARIGEFLRQGMPMIKKKIVFRNYRGLEYYWVIRMGFNPDYRTYIRWIESHYPASQRIDFKLVMKDAPKNHHFDVYLLIAAAKLTHALKKIPGASRLFRALIGFIKKWKA